MKAGRAIGTLGLKAVSRIMITDSTSPEIATGIIDATGRVGIPVICISSVGGLNGTYKVRIKTTTITVSFWGLFL